MDGTQQLLALDSPRVIVLHKGDRAFTYRMKRIGHDEWRKYFESIVHQTVNRGDVREQVYEGESAMLALVTRSIETVEGYGDLTGNWRDRLPLPHRLAVGTALRSVGASDKTEDDVTLSELIEVSVDAAWSSTEDGKMVMFNGLIHRFRRPSIDELKRFNCESSRVRISGSSQDAVSTYASRQAVAMGIYDELIESVDGYAVDGNPLTDVTAIRREMDGAHKATAAIAMFSRDGDISIL